MIEYMSELVSFIQAIATGTSGYAFLRVARHGIGRAKVQVHQLVINM